MVSIQDLFCRDDFMEKIDIKFCYKGKRDYITGADIYHQTAELLKERYPELFISSFRMVFHGFIHNHCQLLLAEELNNLAKPKAAKMEFSFVSDKQRIIGSLIEKEQPVNERIPYPEEDIIKECVVRGKSVTISKKVPFTAIDVLVAINKHLHHTVYPAAEGKWIFTRMDLQRLLRQDDLDRFKVQLIQNLGNRLTKASIFVDDEGIGDIYYLLIRQR